MEIEKLTTALKNAKNNTDIRKALNENSMLIKNLNFKIKEIDINTSKTLHKLISPKYCQALIITIEKLIEQGQNEVAKTLLKDVLISRGENQGKFFEMMTYYCLFKMGINFRPQVHIEAENCFKDCEKGYDADGEILEFSCVFDVKEFGIGFPHIKDFKKKLQKQVDQLFDKKIKSFLDESQNTIKKLEEKIDNQTCVDLMIKEKLNNERRKQDRMNSEVENGLWKYKVYVDGSCNMGMDELSKQIENVASVAEKLVDQAWEDRINRWKNYSTWNSNNLIVKHGKGFFKERIKNLEITCTLESEICKKVRGESYNKYYEIDIYEWAKNNKFYFMGDASQFVSNQPYMIICVLDKQDNIFLDDVNQYNIYFRTLCRRIFIELNRMTERNIKTSFDGKAKAGYSVSEAVKKLTGIIFIEISELINENRFGTPMWIYLNPNADNPLYKHQINSLYLNSPEILEEYKNDNY